MKINDNEIYLPSITVYGVRVENQCLRICHKFDDIDYGMLCIYSKFFNTCDEKLLIRALNRSAKK